MPSGAVEMNKPENPFAIRAFCGKCIMVVAQHLTNLIHQFQVGVWGEFRNLFHYGHILKTKSGKYFGIFSTFCM